MTLPVLHSFSGRNDAEHAIKMDYRSSRLVNENLYGCLCNTVTRRSKSITEPWKVVKDLEDAMIEYAERYGSPRKRGTP
jgi:hypothetical protein